MVVNLNTPNYRKLTEMKPKSRLNSPITKCLEYIILIIIFLITIVKYLCTLNILCIKSKLVFRLFNICYFDHFFVWYFCDKNFLCMFSGELTLFSRNL